MSEIVSDRPTAVIRKGIWGGAFWLILCIVLIFYVAVEILSLNTFQRGFDEGVHLMWARLLAHGYRPYSEVFIGYPPLFPEGLALAWRLTPKVTSVRAAVVIWNGLGLLGVALAAKEVAGYKAGIGAMLLLLLTPYHIFYSRAILADLPAISLATFAVWLGMRYVPDGRARWLLLAGSAFGASLLIKPLFPFGILVLGVLVLERHLEGCSTKWLLGRDLGLLAVSVLLPWLIAFLIYNPAALYEQAIAFRIVARENHAFDLSGKLQHVWSLVLNNPGLLLLAGYGLFRLPKLSRHRWAVVMWLGTALLAVFYQSPLRTNHLSVLLPPLALLGGIGIAGLAKHLSDNSQRKRAIIAAGGLVIYLVTLPISLKTLQDERLRAYAAEGNGDMVTFIKHMTSPEDCIITDDPWVAIDTDLLMPPDLAETSETRIRSGYLTWTEVVSIAQESDCAAVVASDNRENFQEYFPGFLDWVRDHYLIQLDYPHHEVYLAKRDVRTPVGLPATNLGGQIRLYSGGLNTSVLRAGQPVSVRLFWEVRSPVSSDYKVFVHLRNTENETVAQADRQPFAGLLPTSAWPTQGVIAEPFWFPLPAELPDGIYRLLVGLYHPDTGERLPVIDDTSGENAVILGTIRVASP